MVFASGLIWLVHGPTISHQLAQTRPRTIKPNISPELFPTAQALLELPEFSDSVSFHGDGEINPGATLRRGDTVYIDVRSSNSWDDRSLEPVINVYDEDVDIYINGKKAHIFFRLYRK